MSLTSEHTHLSQKSIDSHERLIVALDVPNRSDAWDLVNKLGDSVVFYKLGLEMFMSGNYFDLIAQLREHGKKVFVDLKFFDVPETVAAAVRQLRDQHADFVTVHGNQEMIEAAAREKNGIKILAVTVLTSLDQKDIEDLGFQGVNVEELVLSRARRAIEAGADGVISSGLEAPALRDNLGDGFVIVTPGIRPVVNREVDDQKRTVDVEAAFLGGADYIVVGRPIRTAPDPKEAAESIQARDRGALWSRVIESGALGDRTRRTAPKGQDRSSEVSPEGSGAVGERQSDR